MEEEMQDRYSLANTVYYREILSYVQTGRDILNACPSGMISTFAVNKWKP